jgi:heme-degrading monooxygenase HmoA
MIVRVWKAHATMANAPAYRAHLESAVFPVLRSLEGFIDANLLEQRGEEGEVEFVVASRWASLRAVRTFAGEAYENAVVAPAARALLSSYEPQVSHYEVTAECKP